MNNRQVNDAQYIDVVISMYNLNNIVTVIGKHLEFYGNIIEMNHPWIIMMQLLILL